jgi:hypothetical protein
MDTSHNDQLGQYLHVQINRYLYTVISECDKGLITGPLRYVFDQYAYLGGQSLQSDHGASTTSPMTGSTIPKNRNKLNGMETCAGASPSTGTVSVQEQAIHRHFRRCLQRSKRDHSGMLANQQLLLTCNRCALACDIPTFALRRFNETSDLLVTEEFSPDALLSSETACDRQRCTDVPSTQHVESKGRKEVRNR